MSNDAKVWVLGVLPRPIEGCVGSSRWRLAIPLGIKPKPKAGPRKRLSTLHSSLGPLAIKG
jgi:hypothetical protein